MIELDVTLLIIRLGHAGITMIKCGAHLEEEETLVYTYGWMDGV